MKKCCNGDCNQGRDCPERKESNLSKFDLMYYGPSIVYAIFIVLIVTIWSM